MRNFTPLGSKVLIQPNSAKEVTEGGIILANAQTPDEGIVLKVSPDKEFSVKQGDRVKFIPGAGMEIDGLLLIDEIHILLKYDQ